MGLLFKSAAQKRNAIVSASKKQLHNLERKAAKEEKRELRLERHEWTNLTRIKRNKLLTDDDKASIEQIKKEIAAIEDIEKKRSRLLQEIAESTEHLREFLQNPTEASSRFIKHVYLIEKFQKQLNILLKREDAELAALEQKKRKESDRLKVEANSAKDESTKKQKIAASKAASDAALGICVARNDVIKQRIEEQKKFPGFFNSIKAALSNSFFAIGDLTSGAGKAGKGIGEGIGGVGGGVGKAGGAAGEIAVGVGKTGGGAGTLVGNFFYKMASFLKK